MRSFFQQPARPAQRPSQATDRAAPVRIMAVAERTSGLDENLGALLRDMRLALRMTPGELALRLTTSADVIATLEEGRLRALPHWEETQRVVGGLCAIHRVRSAAHSSADHRTDESTHVGAPPERGPAVLQRTAPRTSSPTHADRPSEKTARRKPAPAKAAKPPKAPKPRKSWRVRGFGFGGGRVLMAVATPMVLIAGAVWTIQAQPRMLRDAISALPASISAPVLAGMDLLAVRLAPRRDGLRWIEVTDPSTRKADKLQVGSR